MIRSGLDELRRSTLTGKTVMAFGTSITFGHAAGRSYVDIIAERYGMHLTKLAVNGAVVRMNEENNILSQIKKAPVSIPDFILFDGLANDAYPEVVDNPKLLGEISEGFAAIMDLTTYCGAFEAICQSLLEKYVDSHIIYVATHKTPARTYHAQEVLQALNLRVCRKWSIPTVDLYHASGLNAFIPAYKNKYSYDKCDAEGGNTSTGGTGTHPNKIGYEKYYVPAIVTKMMSLADV
ncbi:MAG: SGNH/GDSL hydrolase family protein [Sporolactobacillus sp.]|nr:SGNH/GDSL hydrolase family protein [Sporolactobacillus sp.]